MSLVDSGRFSVDGIGLIKVGIKSIQQVSGTGVKAINAVVEANTILIPVWTSGKDNSSMNRSTALTSATSVTITDADGYGGLVYVVELYPGYLKSKQTGNTSVGDGEYTDVTISEVNIAKTIVIMTSIYMLEDGTVRLIVASPELTTSTNLRLTNSDVAYSIASQSWELYEINI